MKAHASPPPPKKKSPLRWIASAVVIALAGFWLVRFAYHSFHYEETDDAYVAGHLHQISSRLEGTVAEVLVSDNQAVKAGELLVRLDPQGREIALQKAEAALAQDRAREAQARAGMAQAKAQIAQAQAQVAQAEARVGQAAAELQVAELNLGRNTRLYTSDSRAVAKGDVEATKGLFDAGQASLNGARANLEAAKASVEALQAASEAAAAQWAAAKATVATGEANVRDAKRELSYMNVTAPVAGRVGNRSTESGNRVQPGQALLSLTEPDFWVVANFKETQLARMTKGQAVKIKIDALPGKTFSGHLQSISPASGAQFALLPPDNATGNFTKVVQRVPVKIVFDAGSIRDVAERLRPGLSTLVDVAIR